MEPRNAGGLDPKAYTELAEGESYPPYVGADQSPVEFSIKSIGFGILFGVLFGMANAFLGLRSGLTISTSIPVAVLSVAGFRAVAALGGRSNILETNISQTVGSASSSVASGVIFTLPALFLWGMPPSLVQMTLLAMCGGLLGVLFMIPLRRFLIEKRARQASLSRGDRLRRGARGQRGGRRPRDERVPRHRGGGLPEVPDLLAASDSGRRARRHPRPAQGAARDRSLRRALRGRLHPRAAHRRRDGRGRRAGLAGDHPRDRLLGGGAYRAVLSGDGRSHLRHESRRDLEPLHPLHRRRRRRGGGASSPWRAACR